MSMTLVNNCVNWPREKLYLLDAIVEKGKRITFRNFIRHVGTENVRALATQTFGFRSVYDMRNDWAIGFYKAEVFGKVYYYIDWSAIEYVFTEDGDY